MAGCRRRCRAERRAAVNAGKGDAGWMVRCARLSDACPNGAFELPLILRCTEGRLG